MSNEPMEYTDEVEKITLKKDGIEKEYDVLFTFFCEQNGKIYIGYTDHSQTQEGRENIFVNSYDPVLGIDNLEEVKSQEEVEMLKDFLGKIGG